MVANIDPDKPTKAEVEAMAQLQLEQSVAASKLNIATSIAREIKPEFHTGITLHEVRDRADSASAYAIQVAEALVNTYKGAISGGRA